MDSKIDYNSFFSTYIRMQAELYNHIKFFDGNTLITRHLAITGMFAEVYSWLAETGIGQACYIIIELAKDKEFVKMIDEEKWKISEKENHDIYPNEMDKLSKPIKEYVKIKYKKYFKDKKSIEI